MRRFLLARTTVLGLMALLLAAVVLAFVVPQRFSEVPLRVERWRAAHPWLGALGAAAGLDHVFTTAWFAALVAVFLTAVCLSLAQQIGLAKQRTFRAPAAVGEWTAAGCSGDHAGAAIRAAGYRKLASAGGVTRFVKRPLGYWGNVLLHAGFVVAIASSLVVLSTQQRAFIRLEEGETVAPPIPWSIEEHGVLARPFDLPGPLHLTALATEFWETDELRLLESTVSLGRNDGASLELPLGINQSGWIGATRVYQLGQAGHNFHLLFVRPDGQPIQQGLSFMLPARRDSPSYNEFQLDWMPYLLRGKYFADAEKRSMAGGNPLLVLRLDEAGAVIGEVSLTMGASGSLGPYRVTLVRAARWSGIAFFQATGMAGIFLAFAMIVLGGTLDYFVVPREVRLRSDEHGVGFQWNAARFPEFFMRERDTLRAALGAD